MIDKVVDFLIKENALRVGASPWPTYGESDQSINVDWERLFPRTKSERDGNDWDLYGDGWSPEFGREFLDDIEEALGQGPPERARTADERAEGRSARWDVCAWYQPIHYFGYNWGIFIREDCARSLAVGIARFMPRGTQGKTGRRTTLAKALVRAAVYAYFLHEQYHHKLECLGLRLHVVERSSRYLPYHTMVYQATKGTDEQLEEGLANANMYARLGEEPYRQWMSFPVLEALRAYLRWSFPMDPPGYRKAVDYLRKPDFDAGENLLHGQVKEASLRPAQPTGDWDIAPRLMQSFFTVTSDIWTVIPLGSKPVLPTLPVAPVRTCSTAEMIKLYKQAGYAEVAGGKGSHVKLAKPGAPTMILPGDRRELSPGVAKTAIRVLGGFNLIDLPELLAGRLLLGRAV